MSTYMIILLLFFGTNAIIYDDDINLVYPAGEIFHSPSDTPADRTMGVYNNCTCRESPDALVVCFGVNCKSIPVISISTPVFKFKLSAIEKIRKNDLNHLSLIEALEIEGHSLLKTIEPGSFKQLSQLNILTISSNMMLQYLDEDVFVGLDNLKTLHISKNGFKRVIDVTRALSPKYVPRLDLLDISENVFHIIEAHEFHYMNNTSLQQLNMHLCGIIHIHPKCLQPLKNLKVLRLGQNLFNRTIITDLVVQLVDDGIPLDLLNLLECGLRRTLPLQLLEAVGRSSITDINLARNHFDQIANDSFPDMPNITTMDLRECYIDSVSNEAFKRLGNLTCLLINRNRLTEIPVGVLVPNLTILDIAGNSEDDQTYFFIADGIFENLTLLDNLQLSYNNIQYITKQTFYGLKNLRILNLKYTQLSFIENGVFKHTPKLLHLNLMNNPLLTLMPMTAETFQGLGALHVMLLGYCAIKNLTAVPGLFYYLKNTTYLGLENNEIHTIATNQITFLNYLKRINLENNKLVPWHINILPKNDFIEIIASQNKFTFLTIAMLEDFKTVQYLRLDGNPFRCDCSLNPVAQWLKYNKMVINYTEKYNYIARCDIPEVWRKKSIVLYLRYLKANSTVCENNFFYPQLICALVLIIVLLLIAIIMYLFRWYIRYWIFLSKIRLLRPYFWIIQKKTDEKFDYEYDAFISYSTEDSAWVTELCNVLEPDLKLCIFERDFPPGTTISHAIVHAVTSSRRTVLVVSEAFAKSNWCRWETQLAQYHQLFFRYESVDKPDDTLLLIRLEPIQKYATPTLKYLMNTRIYIDWPKELNKRIEFWDKLKVTLASPKRGHEIL